MTEHLHRGTVSRRTTSLRCLLVPAATLAAVFAGCQKRDAAPVARAEQKESATPAVAEQSTPAASSDELGSGAVDVCSLLTAQEVESVIGEPLTNTQPDRKSENGLDVSQCFFSVATPVNSVSVVLIRKGRGSAGRTPREVWDETFNAGEGENSGKKRHADAPERIDGLGDAAFWLGSPIGGALYVFKADTYLRISVGGATDQRVKLERSKALAELAIKRL